MNFELLYLAVKELRSKKTVKFKRDMLSQIKNKKDRKEFEQGFNEGFIKSFIKSRSKDYSNDK